MTPKERARAQAALKLAIARSSVTAIAAECDITLAAVSQWDICPSSRVIQIEALTNIPRHDLRPDYYPEESS